jgi:metal-responsive CopG/Arc/MetJ family transcriptional regulator
MQNVTLRMADELVESLDEEADNHDLSRSEYIRNILHDRHDESALQRENEQLRAQVDDLQSQLVAANTRIDDANELVEFVEEERDLRPYRERRLIKRELEEDKRRNAGIMRRLAWWVRGGPDISDEELDNRL